MKVKNKSKVLTKILKEWQNKLKTKVKRCVKEFTIDKNKYYWKRKYYKLLRESKKEKERNDLLSVDLRKTYAQKKKYQNLYQSLNEKGIRNENNRA